MSARKPMPPLVPRTAINGVLWPAVGDELASHYQALLFHLGHSQWWKPEDLARQQQRQLAALVAHAAARVPFHAERLRAAGIAPGEPIDAARWQALPVVKRGDLAASGARLAAGRVPDSHGHVVPAQVAGADGKPIRFQHTQASILYGQAFVLREMLWSGVDPRGTLAVIRRGPPGRPVNPRGERFPDWGEPIAHVFATGPTVQLDARVDVVGQLEWLADTRPTMLIAPSVVLHALASVLRERKLRLSSIGAVRAVGPALDPGTRALVAEGFGARVFDSWVVDVVGCLALPCPDVDGHAHVQSESVLLEILDDAGRPCAPGETGRAVATPLHNFATPLLRYDTGERAALGAPCPCGRGLPVVRRALSAG